MPVILASVLSPVATRVAPVSAVTRPSDTPIRDTLDRSLSGILDRIPATPGGYLTGTVADSGVQLEVGHRLSPHWRAGAFVGKAWMPGAGWSWGATVEGRWGPR